MLAKTAISKLKHIGACQEGINFVKKFKTFELAWLNCDSPSRMRWVLTEFYYSKRHDDADADAAAVVYDVIVAATYDDDRSTHCDAIRTLITPQEAAWLLSQIR